MGESPCWILVLKGLDVVLEAVEDGSILQVVGGDIETNQSLGGCLGVAESRFSSTTGPMASEHEATG